LPVLVARLRLEGPAGEPVALEFDVTRQASFNGAVASTSDATGRLDYFSDFGLGWDGLEQDDSTSFYVFSARTVRGRLDLALPASGTRTVTLLLVFWHPDSRAAADHADLPALFDGVREDMEELETATAGFPALLPSSDDEEIDEALRWYMTAGVMLTRVLKDDTTLTMGYAELNQRDSFWTSFMHLYYWPEAERRMLVESAAAVSEDGKVPTCILPLIEREDDIDINEYFLLRVGRYHREYSDLDFLASLFPFCQKAMQYLIGRCEEGSSLPAQQSFWADWKDIGAMEGRRFGPHFVLLYLAALKEMSFVAGELGETAQAEAWDAAYAAADKEANLPVAQGGLWNGQYYVNVWRDGHKDDALLEDQMVAGAWGVIPPERFAGIRAALNDANEQPWGVRETFPYYPAEEFGYEGGDYHNGGVWPWLNFADAVARCRYGHCEDSSRILREVAEWDLKAAGDFLPHENLHGETGEGIRKYVQGWDAGYLAAVVWGLNGKWPQD
jgi:glycogen debranching enzyme